MFSSLIDVQFYSSEEYYRHQQVQFNAWIVQELTFFKAFQPELEKYGLVML